MGENTKQNFISWLQDKNVKKIHPSACISCLEAVSDYAVKHRLSKVSFWQITDYKQFNAIKNSILSSRIFKFFNRSNAKNFDIAGKFYSDFLKEQAEIAEKENPAMSVDAELTQEINLADIIDKASVTEEAISSVEENETESIVETKEPKRCVKHNKFGYGIITQTENGRHTIKFFGDSQAEREISVNFANMHEVPESEYDAVISTLQEGGSVDEKPQPAEPANERVELQVVEEQAESKEIDEQENVDYDANLEGFKQWLYDVKKVNWRTKESFGHYLETLNDYLLSRHLTDKNLLLIEEAELTSISKTLSADEAFQAYDHAQHNCLSVALKFFCEYVRSGAAKFNQEKIKQEEAKKAAEVASKIDFLIVDFSAPADYTFASIKSVSYFGNERTDISTWKNAYQFILSQLYEDYLDRFTLILADNYCAGVRIELSENASDMRSALCVTEGLYAEGNHSAETFVKKLTALLDFCEVDYENVVIKYTKNSKKEETVIEADNNVVLSVDFSSIGDYTFTTVQSVSYFDKTNIKISKWRIAYKFILQELFKDYPDKVYRIINDNDAAGIRIKISRNSADMYTPITIAQGIYAEGNRSAGQIVNIIKGLLDFCNVDYENVIINYTKDKQEKTAQPVPQPIIGNQPVQINSPSRELNYNDRLLEYNRWLADVKKLNENTCNGYCSGIKTIDEYLVKKGTLEKSILSFSKDELSSAMDKIFADEEFLAYNAQQHNRFRAALKAFYEYRTGWQYFVKKGDSKQKKSNVPFEEAAVRQPLWDIYEAAILLDGYLKITEDYNRQLVIADVSKKLRQMAINLGKSIDSKYRNENGISSHIFYIQLSFMNKTLGSMPPKIFKEVVNLYRSDKEKYDAVLKEAYIRCALPQGVTVEEHIKIADFFNNSVLSELFEKLFVYQRKNCEGIVLDVRPPIIGAKKQGEKLRFYVGNNKHIHFSCYMVDYMPYDKPFTEELFDEYCKIIAENDIFFAENSEKITLKTEKFVTSGTTATDSTRIDFRSWLTNVKKLNQNTVRHYCNDLNTIDEYLIKNKIIEKSLLCSDENVLKSVLNSLFNNTRFDLYNKEKHHRFSSPLKLFYEYVTGKLYHESVVPDTAAVQTDIIAQVDQAQTEAVEKFICNAELDGVTLDGLCNEFGFTMTAAKLFVSGCESIVEIKGRLYHQKAFVDWEEGAGGLLSFMQKLMQKNNNYISSAQLYSYACSELYGFLNDNGINDERSVFELAQYLFEKTSFGGVKYKFVNKTLISLPESSIENYYDLICKFAESHDGVFTDTELSEYLVSVGVKPNNLSLKMQIYEKPNFFYYGDGTYLYAKYMHINKEWLNRIKEVLDKLFYDTEGHIILSTISSFWFDKLPQLPCGLQWTPFLLQNILRFYGKQLGARTVYAMYSQDISTLHAMLVTTDSDIQNFSDAVAQYFIDYEVDQRTYDAEELRQLLVQAGMIHGGELIGNMNKALANDWRFAWNVGGDRVTVKVE